MTNEEKIKSMSTEELASFFCENMGEDCDGCPAEKFCNNRFYDEYCFDVIFEWLKQEAEDGQH